MLSHENGDSIAQLALNLHILGASTLSASLPFSLAAKLNPDVKANRYWPATLLSGAWMQKLPLCLCQNSCIMSPQQQTDPYWLQSGPHRGNSEGHGCQEIEAREPVVPGSGLENPSRTDFIPSLLPRSPLPPPKERLVHKNCVPLSSVLRMQLQFVLQPSWQRLSLKSSVSV